MRDRIYRVLVSRSAFLFRDFRSRVPLLYNREFFCEQYSSKHGKSGSPTLEISINCRESFHLKFILLFIFETFAFTIFEVRCCRKIYNVPRVRIERPQQDISRIRIHRLCRTLTAAHQKSIMQVVMEMNNTRTSLFFIYYTFNASIYRFTVIIKTLKKLYVL